MAIFEGLIRSNRDTRRFWLPLSLYFSLDRAFRAFEEDEEEEEEERWNEEVDSFAYCSSAYGKGTMGKSKFISGSSHCPDYRG